MGILDRGNWKQIGSFDRRLSRKADRYYLAYGSNLLPERIYERCPDAKFAGRAELTGWRLLFKKSKTGCYATIEQDANRTVSCVIFKISEYDEALLDKYEGYPKYYYKRKFEVKILFNSGKWSKEPKKCVAYILHEERNLGAPPKDYMKLLLSAYEHWGFDEHRLWEAISDSIGDKPGMAYMREVLKGGREE